MNDQKDKNYWAEKSRNEQEDKDYCTKDSSVPGGGAGIGENYIIPCGKRAGKSLKDLGYEKAKELSDWFTTNGTQEANGWCADLVMNFKIMEQTVDEGSQPMDHEMTANQIPPHPSMVCSNKEMQIVFYVEHLSVTNRNQFFSDLNNWMDSYQGKEGLENKGRK